MAANFVGAEPWFWRTVGRPLSLELGDAGSASLGQFQLFEKLADPPISSWLMCFSPLTAASRFRGMLNEAEPK